MFLRVFFLLLFPLDCLASDPRGTDFGHRLRRHRGNPVHGVHAETAQRITEAPAFHAEGVKGGSSYGKTKADLNPRNSHLFGTGHVMPEIFRPRNKVMQNA